jgi:hypothetical protein
MVKTMLVTRAILRWAETKIVVWYGIIYFHQLRVLFFCRVCKIGHDNVGKAIVNHKWLVQKVGPPFEIAKLVRLQLQ